MDGPLRDIIIPEFWTPYVKPSSICRLEIDWSDCINSGLRFQSLLDGSGGCRELVQGIFLTASGTIGARTENFQACSDLDGSDYYELQHRAPYAITGDLTLCWAGVIDNTSGYHHLLGKHLSNGATNSPFEFRIETGSTTQKLIRANATSRREMTNASGVSTGTFHVLFVTSKTPFSAANTKFWVDGTKYSATDAFGSVTDSTDANAALRIGRRPDGATQLDGAISLVAGWARILDDGEIRSKSAALFRGLKSSDRRVFIVVPTVGGSLDLDADPGVLTLTGQAADLGISYAFESDPGVLSLTGVSADYEIAAGVEFESDPGVLTLTGATADYVATGADLTLEATQGELTLTGQAADYGQSYAFDVVPGLLSLDSNKAIVVIPGVLDVTDVSRTGGRSRDRHLRQPAQRKYPRYVRIGNEQVLVRSWSEEVAVIQAYLSKQERQREAASEANEKRNASRRARYNTQRLKTLSEARATERKANIERSNAALLDLLNKEPWL